jgi:putative peptidoglycan lipid II flippase
MIKRFTDNFTKGEKISESITRSAILIATMGLASRILGLVRDRILAAKFGAGDVLDAYYAAFKIPDLIYNLLILGALSAAFIPVFSSLMSRKDKEQAGWKLVNSMISVGLILVVLVAVIIFIFTDFFIGLIAFGYSDEKRELVVQMTRIMLISPIILGVSGIFGGILNSFKKFFFYSLSPIFYNLGIIFGATILSMHFGYLGLALGVVIGALMHLLVQLPEVRRCGFKFKMNFDWEDKYFKKVIKLMIPRTFGIATAQINLVVIVILSSTLPSGSLAVFNFANNLQSVPLGLFGISFAVASFPVLSRLWAQDKVDEFVDRLTGTIKKIIFFVIPISALIYALRAQIVRVALGTGEFNWEDTSLTFEVLGIFVISLWAQSLIPLLARAFYATHNTKVPFLVGIFSGILNIVLALLFIKSNGILGLVTAFTVANMVNAVLLFFSLRVRIGKIKKQGIIKLFGKVIFSTVAMLIVIQALKELIGAEPFGNTQTLLGIFTQLSVAITGGIISFIGISWLLGVQELEHFAEAIHKKLVAKKVIRGARDEMGS